MTICHIFVASLSLSKVLRQKHLLGAGGFEAAAHISPALQ